MAKRQSHIYLDYAATTPVDHRVVKAMLPFITQNFGNSVSLHSYGRKANEALEKSRVTIGEILNADHKEIIFTSSATESNNLALIGVAFANKHKGKHIIVSSIEHDCVLESAKWLAKQGFEIHILPVDKYGLVDPQIVSRAIKKGTILVSVMHANNEIGTIEPISEIGRICRQKNVYFHTDAAQTFGKVPIDVKRMNIDLLTASSHKMYGPKGAALLYIRKGVFIEPLLHGGGHESGKRSSTVNVAAIVGFAKAADICRKETDEEAKRLLALRDRLIYAILKKVPYSYLNGHPKKRLPNNVNICFSFVEGESIIMELDRFGIAASTASACASFKLTPSHVLLACGLHHEEVHGSVRLSLGRWTKKADIDKVIEILPGIVKKLRQISPFKKGV